MLVQPKRNYRYPLELLTYISDINLEEPLHSIWLSVSDFRRVRAWIEKNPHSIAKLVRSDWDASFTIRFPKHHETNAIIVTRFAGLPNMLEDE